MVSMVSRSNVGAIRSMRIDRGTRIRTFRELGNTCDGAAVVQHGHSDAHTQFAQDTPNGDANGLRYRQALTRLSKFKVQHKNRVTKDRRRADWQEEHSHLCRASQELTKAIQDMLRTPIQNKTNSSNAPAWGGSISTINDKNRNLRLGGRRATSSSPDNKSDGQRIEDGHTHNKHKTLSTHTNGTARADNAHTATSTCATLSCWPKEVEDLHTEEQELDKARRQNMEADRANVLDLRTLVTELTLSLRAQEDDAKESTKKLPTGGGYSTYCQPPSVRGGREQRVGEGEIDNIVAAAIPSTSSSDVATRGTNGPSTNPAIANKSSKGTIESRAGIMAELLIQARTAHGKAGDDLAHNARLLEAEVVESRRAVARALAPAQEAEVGCPTQAWVLNSVGINSRHDKQDSIVSDVVGPANHGFDEGMGCDDGVQEALVTADILDRLRAVEAEHSTRLTGLREDFLRTAAAPNSAGSVEAALDKSGGWTADQHFRFTKVLKAARGSSGGGVGSTGQLGGSAITARLSAELPDVAAIEITRHETWYRLRDLHMAKRRVEKERHNRDLEELVTWGKDSLEAMRQEERAAAARAGELQERERRRVELNDLLREQREVRDKLNSEHRERKEQEARERGLIEAEEAERKEADDETKRKAVAQYRASLQELRAKEAEAREAEELAAEADRVQRMPKNKARIGFREERARQKREEQARREREMEALEANRLEVLEKLAASVPYAEACANAKAKLDHITAATAAHFDQFSQFDRSRGHCPMFGFNSKEIFRDARFKLGLYLREAGVSGTKAAHSAVMRAVGPLPDAPF